MKNDTLKKLTLSSVMLFTLMTVSSLSRAADTIKVGVLHSLSGTMAISETTLKDTMLMLIEEQNNKGGVLGKKLSLGLAVVCREGPRADHQKQDRRYFRLLDIGVAQIGTAGLRGTQQYLVLSGAVRG
jgi:uncharacterized protein (DUF1684 family)